MTPRRDISAYYGATVVAFVEAAPNEVLGRLAAAFSFDVLDETQRRAWQEEIGILQDALVGLDGWVFLEFDVPRLGSRVDAVVVSGPAVFPIEFKCGESRFTRDAENQAWDYGLDLKNFHLESHSAAIFPLLVATGAAHGDAAWKPPHHDGVCPPRRAVPNELRAAIDEALARATGDPLDGDAWARAPYAPTPTIIEAARALYSQHTVEAITRNDAGARNLAITSVRVEEIIERSRVNDEKSIVFVTGVPGAGKTLVGLNVATRRRELGEARAVFLSGNGPLVAVLREALTRDEWQRQKREVAALRERLAAGGMLSAEQQERAEQTPRKGHIGQPVKSFIQNVHHFRDDGVRTDDAPGDHVVIFDEAQRAWDLAKTADFMKRRKGIPDFARAESEFLISYLDRHAGWAVIICLVGGGQEIHTGEAGIASWLEALRTSFPNWRTYVPPDLRGPEYAAAEIIERFDAGRIVTDCDLHLSSSLRSFRSERVSEFVGALLDLETDRARELLREVSRRYPIALTRDLQRAKRWLRERRRGSEQVGLVASSQAMRLKPHAIDVRVSVDPINWFLGDRSDTRSSHYLEDAATEFQVQGLEVDWACVTWDADLRLDGDGWRYSSFRGDKWIKVVNAARQRYLLNSYRVLLTRARQGMAIFVPPGDPEDDTRRPALYDGTFALLEGLGIEVI